MKVLCIFLFIAFASSFYIDNNGTYQDKIVGGDHIRIEYAPYQAMVLRWMSIDNICGATIIHHSWVITAAHCVDNVTHILVRTGSGFRLAFGHIHTIENIIMHRHFDTNRRNNDIALIQLAHPIQFNNEQQPIEIAKPHDIPTEGEWMRITGFGQTGLYLGKSDFLKAAHIPVVSQENCRRAYSSQIQPITDNMFCAGNGHADACHGDSGGPGVIHGKLYGIIAFGVDCSSIEFPGVFTRMHKYHDWVEEKTGLRF